MRRLSFFLLFLPAFLWAGVQFHTLNPDDYQRTAPVGNNAIASYSAVLSKARLAVVNISTQKSVRTQQNHPLFNDPFFRQFFDQRFFNVPQERVQRSLGSGVIVTRDGYIVTNNHVVEGADKVLVNIQGKNREYEAKVIGTDAKSDVAVIKIDAEDLPYLPFYDSDRVEVGDVVFAIGNPFGVGDTVTQGIVSATNRSSVGIVEYEDFIQTDAAINPGNSGGAGQLLRRADRRQQRHPHPQRRQQRGGLRHPRQHGQDHRHRADRQG